MDPYDFEELAFCEEGRPLQELEDEAKYIQAVFDEENAFYKEDGPVTSSWSTRKNYLSKPEPKSLKNCSRRCIKRKAEVWMVNPKYKAKQKRTIESNAALDEENPTNGSKAINDDDLSCEGIVKSKVKIGILETSRKEKLTGNSTTSNIVGSMNREQIWAEKFFKGHEEDDGDCMKDVVEDCELCIEKFAKASSPGYSVREEHCYSIPVDEDDDDVHQCNLCKLKFKETDDLKTHLKAKHVLQLREILKNCFHVGSRNDLKVDSLIVQVLPEERGMKCTVKLEASNELQNNASVKNEFITEK